MARPIKASLDYFPVDVGFLDDPKVALVMAAHGPIVANVVLRLLSEIYGREGYWMPWNEDLATLFAINTCHNTITVEQAKAIVEDLLRREFFDPEIYKRTGKLTSHGIQTRWAMAVKINHRKVTIDPSICLIEVVSSEETPAEEEFPRSKLGGNPRSSGVSSRETPIKEIKEKEIKAITTPPNPPLPPEVGGGVPFDECSDREGVLAYSNAVIEAWNEVFRGTPREAVAMNVEMKPNYRGAVIKAYAEGITLDQFKRAFRALKSSRFSWNLHSAVKPDNVRMLLTEGAIAAKRPRSGPNAVYEPTRETVYGKAEDFWK